VVAGKHSRPPSSVKCPLCKVQYSLLSTVSQSFFFYFGHSILGLTMIKIFSFKESNIQSNVTKSYRRARLAEKHSKGGSERGERLLS